MGRPAKTLMERVLANTFRPGRYGALLAAERLPARSPFAGEQAVRLWRELRRTQQRYCDEPEHRDFHARDFGLLVRALHGGRVPAWYRDGRERSVREIDRFLQEWSGA